MPSPGTTTSRRLGSSPYSVRELRRRQPQSRTRRRGALGVLVGRQYRATGAILQRRRGASGCLPPQSSFPATPAECRVVGPDGSQGFWSNVGGGSVPREDRKRKTRGTEAPPTRRSAPSDAGQRRPAHGRDAPPTAETPRRWTSTSPQLSCRPPLGEQVIFNHSIECLNIACHTPSPDFTLGAATRGVCAQGCLRSLPELVLAIVAIVPATELPRRARLVGRGSS